MESGFGLDRDALWRGIVKNNPDVFRWYAYGSSINLKGSEARDRVLSRLVLSSLSFPPSSPPPLPRKGEWTSLVLSEATFEVSAWNCLAETSALLSSLIDKSFRLIFFSSRRDPRFAFYIKMKKFGLYNLSYNKSKILSSIMPKFASNIYVFSTIWYNKEKLSKFKIIFI